MSESQRSCQASAGVRKRGLAAGLCLAMFLFLSRHAAYLKFAVVLDFQRLWNLAIAILLRDLDRACLGHELALQHKEKHWLARNIARVVKETRTERTGPCCGGTKRERPLDRVHRHFVFHILGRARLPKP